MRTEVALHEAAIGSASISPSSSTSAMRPNLNASLTPRRIRAALPSPSRAVVSPKADDRTQPLLSVDPCVDGQLLSPMSMRYKTAAAVSESLEMSSAAALAGAVHHASQTERNTSQHLQQEDQVASLQRAVAGMGRLSLLLDRMWMVSVKLQVFAWLMVSMSSENSCARITTATSIA
jgi:hypothetical protein